MPYYANGNLSNVIQKGLSLKDKKQIVQDILRGLFHLHDQKIIHRDMKPGNILMHKEEGKWIPKIADFGLSKISANDAVSTANTSIGITYAYAAPEQINPERFGEKILKNVDVWALGVILFEIFVEKRPFRSDELVSLQREIQNLEYNREELKTIPLPYRDVVQKMLSP